MFSNMERVAAMPDAFLYVNRDGRRADDCVDSMWRKFDQDPKISRSRSGGLMMISQAKQDILDLRSTIHDPRSTIHDPFVSLCLNSLCLNYFFSSAAFIRVNLGSHQMLRLRAKYFSDS